MDPVEDILLPEESVQYSQCECAKIEQELCRIQREEVMAWRAQAATHLQNGEQL